MMDEDSVLFSCSEHIFRSFRKMETFRKNSQLCDITLVVGDRRIRAHRLVLGAFSDYFSAMFTADMSDSNREVVHLADMNPVALEALVKYAYSSKLDIRVDNVENLLSVACILQVEEVKEACSEFMKHQLHPSNCLGIRAFAEGHGCHGLFKLADSYTKENFVEVVRNQEFLLLNPDCMLELLSSDDLNVSSESQVLEALCIWARHDLEKRKKLLPKLLGFVRLPLLSPQYLVDNVEMSPLFRDLSQCRELIIEAMKFHLLPERRFELQTLRTKPRKSTTGKLFVVGGKSCVELF